MYLTIHNIDKIKNRHIKLKINTIIEEEGMYIIQIHSELPTYHTIRLRRRDNAYNDTYTLTINGMYIQQIPKDALLSPDGFLEYIHQLLRHHYPIEF